MATLTGATSGVTNIPQQSSGNNTTAQTLVNGISTINGGAQVNGNTLTPTSTVTTNGVVVIGVGSTTPYNAGAVNLGTLQPNVVAVVINNTSTTTLSTSSNSGNDSIVAGYGGLFLTDNGFFDTINVGGGTNSVTLAGVGGSFSGDGSNTITLQNNNRGAASSVTGTTASSDTIIGTVGSNANLVYTDGGGKAYINPTQGNVTIMGGAGGTQTVFGGGAYIGPGGSLVTTNAFLGSLTVTNGTGFFQGGTAGSNNIGSSTVGGSTLVGGGANDTLRAGGPGDVLVAGPGNATLDASNSVGNDSLFASNTAATTEFGSKSLGDTFFFGTSTVQGPGNAFKGEFIAAHTAPNSAVNSLNNNVSNTFAISGGAEFGTVYDFITGIDKVAVSSAQGTTAVLYAPASGSGQYVLTTSTGTTISFLTKIQASDISGVTVTTKLV